MPTAAISAAGIRPTSRWWAMRSSRRRPCWRRCRPARMPTGSFRFDETLGFLVEFDIARDFEPANTPRTVDPRSLGAALEKLLPAQRNLVYDAGNFLGIVPYLSVPGPGHFKLTSDFASIGMGFGTALGVAKARPMRPPCWSSATAASCTTGRARDGGARGPAAGDRADERLRLWRGAAFPQDARPAGGEVGVPRRRLCADRRGLRLPGRRPSARWTTWKKVAPLLAKPEGPVLLDCKLNAAVAAPFMSEFHEFETQEALRPRLGPPAGPLAGGRRAPVHGSRARARRRAEEGDWMPSPSPPATPIAST